MGHWWCIERTDKHFFTTFNTSNAETQTQSIEPKKSEESDNKQDRINANNEESLVQLAENANKSDNDQDQKCLDEDNHPKKNSDNVAAAEKVNKKEDDFTHEPDSQNSSKLPNKKNVKASNKKKGNKINNKNTNQKVKKQEKKSWDNSEVEETTTIKNSK